MHKTEKSRPPFLLIILDGYGYREERDHNAIAVANTPHWDRLWQDYPHAFISTSGIDVGLPKGQMGNSEVGHLNMGAGRIIPQEFTRIHQAIADGSFFSNSVLINAIHKTISNNRKLHIIGLLSPGGVHSHEEQIEAMVKLACQEGAKV